MDKKQFVELITALRDQYDQDIEKSERLSKALGAEVPLPDRSHLVNAIFKTLHRAFPPGDDFCSIGHFCWDINFGRDVHDYSIERLYEELAEEAREDQKKPLLKTESPYGAPFDEEKFNPDLVYHTLAEEKPDVNDKSLTLITDKQKKSLVRILNQLVGISQIREFAKMERRKAFKILCYEE